MKEPPAKYVLQQEFGELIVPSSKVAHVQPDHSLEHALLVLIKSGYSAIPVLDRHYRIQGLISHTRILESILGVERMEFDTLHLRRVEDVMNRQIPSLRQTDTFQRALELSINHPFVCVEDEDGIFLGILTRKAILAFLYRYLRNME